MAISNTHKPIKKEHVDWGDNIPADAVKWDSQKEERLRKAIGKVIEAVEKNTEATVRGLADVEMKIGRAQPSPAADLREIFRESLEKFSETMVEVLRDVIKESRPEEWEFTVKRDSELLTTKLIAKAIK